LPFEDVTLASLADWLGTNTRIRTVRMDMVTVCPSGLSGFDQSDILLSRSGEVAIGSSVKATRNGMEKFVEKCQANETVEDFDFKVYVADSLEQTDLELTDLWEKKVSETCERNLRNRERREKQREA
jgi:hypothetical protein